MNGQAGSSPQLGTCQPGRNVPAGYIFCIVHTVINNLPNRYGLQAGITAIVNSETACLVDNNDHQEGTEHHGQQTVHQTT